MDLTDDDLGSLARFLAPRVTPDGRPAPPVTDLIHPVDPAVEQAWGKALREARARGRLATVLQQAAAARPEDDALREAVSLVPGVRPAIPEPRPAAAFALVAMLFLLFGFASATTAGVVLLVQAALPTPGEVAVASAPAPDRDDLPPVEPPTTAGIGVVRAPATDATGAGASVPAPPRVQLPPPRPVGPCEREGWFYAGWRRPKGDRFVVPYPVNVRAEPPSVENRWDSSSEVRCYLRKGDVVTIDRPPVDAGHGQLWIHVGPGLVLRP